MEAMVLASGSSGNAVLVRSGTVALLVDAGVSALQIRRRLEVFGLSPDAVDAVLLTHEHSDHVRGLEVFLRRHRPAPVWATRGTWGQLAVRSHDGGELVPGRSISFGMIEVTPVATSHDAAEPVAFVFDDGCRRLALCTDTGVFTGLLERRLQSCDGLLLEANHDRDMLRHGPYPWPLKQRISSSHGHLANHQSQEAVDCLRSPRLRALLGLHLSAENNSPTLVHDALSATAGAGVKVAAVTRTEMVRLQLDGEEAVVERFDLPSSAYRR